MLRPVATCSSDFRQFANSSSNNNNDPMLIPETAAHDNGHALDTNRADISHRIAEAKQSITKNQLGSVQIKDLEIVLAATQCSICGKYLDHRGDNF